MQESITASLFRLLILLLILGAIVVAGWNEPLRNRFLSRQEIEAFNPEPAPPPDADWMWEPGRSGIERGAYKDGSSTSRFRPTRREGRTSLDR